MSNQVSLIAFRSIVVVSVLRAMPRSRRYTVLGTPRLEKSLSPAILSHLQKIRPGALPLSVRSVALGHRLLHPRRNRRSWWPAFRPRRSLPGRTLRGMAVLLDHPARPNRHANHRNYYAECRFGQHRG